MIQIVDYGVGNIQAIIRIFKRLGIDAERVQNPQALEVATHLVLPGVGNFDVAMQRLNDSGLRPTLDNIVLDKKVPVLGVCVGMQMMATSSDEGILPGLNWIPGRVKSFNSHEKSSQLPSPHMGWNVLHANGKSKLFCLGFDEPPQFYFLHSYFYEAQNRSDVAATAFYGIDFDVAISNGNIHGIQCHPEKSHNWGMQLFQNFSKL